MAGENGQPIAKANVSIHGPENYSVPTDTNGQFLFTDVVVSSYQITVTKIGYRSYTNRVIVADKLVIADVILEKEDSQTISGMVMNKATQKPVSNVQLTTIPLNIVAISDDNGNYQFNQKFEPANYVVITKLPFSGNDSSLHWQTKNFEKA